jgi:hypothetical protein
LGNTQAVAGIALLNHMPGHGARAPRKLTLAPEAVRIFLHVKSLTDYISGSGPAR